MANEQAKAFIDQATQSLQNSQFDKALELIEQAIAIEPGSSDSFVLKGICLSQLNQPDAATDAFKQAILLSPYNPKAYYNLAVHMNALGNKKEAMEFAREAVGVDPRHTGARQLLSSLEQELSGAKEDFVKDRIDVRPPTQAAPPPGSGAPDPQLRPPTGPPPSQASRPGPTPPAQKGEPAKPYVAPANANPYAGINPTSQFSNQGFNRPGYQPQAGAIPWVENMGTAWTVIGWVVAASWGLLLIAWFSIVQSVMTNPPKTPDEMMQRGALPLDILGLCVMFATLFWMILDTMNRRKSGWWVAGTVVSCCCGTNLILMPIYLLVGRKVD